jgi:hypothetical protein
MEDGSIHTFAFETDSDSKHVARDLMIPQQLTMRSSLFVHRLVKVALMPGLGVAVELIEEMGR